jgi:hypothetical protein
VLNRITEQLPESENETFRKIGFTIGGMMVFPEEETLGQQSGDCIARLTRFQVARSEGCLPAAK